MKATCDRNSLQSGTACLYLSVDQTSLQVGEAVSKGAMTVHLVLLHAQLGY